jgi:hypothetical protein
VASVWTKTVCVCVRLELVGDKGEGGDVLMSHSIQMKYSRAWTSPHQVISDANSGGGRE